MEESELLYANGGRVYTASEVQVALALLELSTQAVVFPDNRSSNVGTEASVNVPPIQAEMQPLYSVVNENVSVGSGVTEQQYQVEYINTDVHADDPLQIEHMQTDPLDSEETDEELVIGAQYTIDSNSNNAQLVQLQIVVPNTQSHAHLLAAQHDNIAGFVIDSNSQGGQLLIADQIVNDQNENSVVLLDTEAMHEDEQPIEQEESMIVDEKVTDAVANYNMAPIPNAPVNQLQCENFVENQSTVLHYSHHHYHNDSEYALCVQNIQFAEQQVNVSHVATANVLQPNYAYNIVEPPVAMDIGYDPREQAAHSLFALQPPTADVNLLTNVMTVDQVYNTHYGYADN